MTSAFLLTSLLIVVSPGTGVVYTLAMSLSQGMRAGILATIGCALGVVPHLVLAISGAALFLQGHPQALTLLKYAGGVWLLYLAWQLYRDESAIQVAGSGQTPQGARIVWSGILMNLLNPKLTLFFFAFLPQFVTDENQAFRQMTLLGMAFILMTFLVFLLYGLFAAALREQLFSRPLLLSGFRRVTALVLGLLSVKLALF